MHTRPHWLQGPRRHAALPTRRSITARQAFRAVDSQVVAMVVLAVAMALAAGCAGDAH